MFTRVSTEVIDAESGGYHYFGDNEQLFDVTLPNGKRYTFAMHLRIGLMSEIDDVFSKCETPEDIAQEIQEIFVHGDYMVDVVICDKPME